MKLHAILVASVLGGALAMTPGTPGAAQTLTGSTAPALPLEPTTSLLRQRIEARSQVVIVRREPLEPIALAGGSALRIEALGAFEPGFEEQRTLGLALTVKAEALPGGERVHYMDFHEIESLLRAVALLDQVARESAGGVPTDADYETLEGLTVGVEVRGSRARPWVGAGPADERVRLDLPGDGLRQLQQRLELGRSRLFSD